MLSSFPAGSQWGRQCSLLTVPNLFNLNTYLALGNSFITVCVLSKLSPCSLLISNFQELIFLLFSSHTKSVGVIDLNTKVYDNLSSITINDLTILMHFVSASQLSHYHHHYHLDGERNKVLLMQTKWFSNSL